MTLAERTARLKKRRARLNHEIKMLQLKLEYPSVLSARASGRQVILGTLEDEMNRKLENLCYQREKTQLQLKRLTQKNEPKADRQTIASPPDKKKRGRPREEKLSILDKLVKKVCLERGPDIKPKELIELPQIKELTEWYAKPLNCISKSLMRVRQNLALK